MPNDLLHWLSGMPWFGWIGLVAILGAFVSGIARMKHAHLERMEMIRQGMNPDGGKPAAPHEV
jgi:hypothetical protein